MALTINTNLASLNTQRHLVGINNAGNLAMQRLSSGLRINSARDDAAGLAIGTRMDSQVRGLNVAIRNANDATSLIQVADGALNTISSALQRMRELSVQAANGAYSNADRTQLNTEYQQLALEITRIANSTTFNGQNIISTNSGTFNFQVGANSGQTLSVTTTDASALMPLPGDLTSAANATTAISAIDTAIDSLNTTRSTYGAALNRLDFTMQNLRTSAENQTAARSRIMDTDFAQETAALARQQVLQQAGIAMLSQANQMPSMILGLLR